MLKQPQLFPIPDFSITSLTEVQYPCLIVPHNSKGSAVHKVNYQYLSYPLIVFRMKQHANIEMLHKTMMNHFK